MGWKATQLTVLVALASFAGAAARAAETPPERADPAVDPALDPALDPAARDALLTALTTRRRELDLAPLASPPALAAAAQAHAEAMARDGWLGFTSPDGVSVEQRVESAGYAAAVVAAKVFRAPVTDDPEQLATRWWGAGADASRNSLFHSQVTEAGLGIARRGDELFYAFVLTRPAAPLPAAAAADGDVDALRTGFLAAVNDARAARGLSPLRRDATLERAAQAHAVALLPVLQAGGSADTVENLAQRVQEERGDVGSPQLTGGSATWQQRSSMRAGSRLRAGALGQTIVVDAPDGAEAVATIAGLAQTADLFEPGYLLLGVGVALARGEGEPRSVWVACLTRR